MKKPRILIVEDESIVARDIDQQLVMIGYQPVGRTAYAEQAVTLAEEMQPDLVLMDIILAGEMDGITAAVTIRDRLQLPVIFLTAFSGGEILNRAKLAEPYGYIFKPFNERDLQTTIEIALHKHQIEKALRRSEAKYHTLYASTSDAVMLLDEKGYFDCNRATLGIFGCATREEFCSKHPADLSPPEQPDGMDSRILANQQIVIAIEKGSHRFEWMHKRANSNESFPAEVLLSAMELDGKQVLQATVRDITKRKQTELQLQIAAIAFEAQEGIIVTDAEGTVLRVNKAFSSITGYSADEVIGNNPRMLSSGLHDAYFYETMWSNIHRTGRWKGEIWDRRKSGEIYPEHLNITAVKDKNDNVTHYVGTVSDIAMSREAADEIKHLAFYDSLTRLPNRRLLLDRLQQTMASSARNGKDAALLFIDLDNFKNLNDSQGHDIGDMLLQQVAQRLETCVREGDTVARLGGDEFVVLLKDLDEDSLRSAEQAEMVGEKVLATLNQVYQLASGNYLSTPSIGVTLFKGHQQMVDELLKQADIAMYQSKKAGRNTLRFFDPEMQESIDIRAALEGDLRNALKQGQFHLYYQLQVDASNRPLGAETLIRWIHPERGFVSPPLFIPLAEETGLILPIGRWVLETACARLKSWQADAHTRELVLAVNVSARQFHQADFASHVQAAIQHHAINPNLLKLELTESLLVENIEVTIKTMNALHDLGVLISLDDFGTGYSSLQYLKRLPLDQLKIDMSFVRELASDSSDRAIVRTIIAMAHSLKLDVIAEGVETEQQRQILMNKGCTHYQGYLFSKPVPIEQFEALIANNSKSDNISTQDA